MEAALALIEATCALAFVKEDFGMLAPPRCPTLTILADQNSESDTGAPIALVAVLAERQHAIGQLVIPHSGGGGGATTTGARRAGFCQRSTGRQAHIRLKRFQAFQAHGMDLSTTAIVIR